MVTGKVPLYRAAKATLGPFLRHLWDIEVTGLDNLPTDGPYVLAANHRSFMDSIFLASVVPQPIAFMAKAEYFDRRSTAWLFRSTGQIPVRRGSSRGAVQAIAAARGVLGSGGVIGIYPEGTRSRDGRLHRGSTGVARLARSQGAPIVPVGLVGTADVQAPGSLTPHPFHTVTVSFGAPHQMSDNDSGSTGLRNATDRLMHSIAGLCGQEYAA